MTDRLTQQQEAYFERLRAADPSPGMARVIEDARRNLAHQNQTDNVVRGLTRVRGFQRND